MNLPALKGLRKLSEYQPVIIVDSREQCPLTFRNLPSERRTLATGDYSYRGGEEAFSVERKSIADLVGCCTGDNRQRFERELHRLRGFQFKRLLVIGSREDLENHNYRSQISPQAVAGSLAAWEVRYSVPVVWASSPDEAATLIERWVWYACREIVTTANQLLRKSESESDKLGRLLHL